MVKFWDASAALLICLAQPGSSDIRRLYGADGDVVLWWGTRVECMSAIARLVREGQLDYTAETEARGRLGTLVQQSLEVAPTEGLRMRAERALRVHPLRAADALQLAAALVWSHDHPADREFVCLDTRLREAA